MNGLNQATGSGSEALYYDGRGNLKQAAARTFGYTYENRLASADGARFAHDPMGRMHWINGHTTLQYDGDALVAELAGDGPYARRYVHGAGVDEPLVWYEGAGTGDRRWLHQDERGSVVAVSNGSGWALAVNSYDEYGMPASGNLGRFGYTGQTWLPEAGAWHYKARNYAPGLGRFMQTDPIGTADQVNLYAYSGLDPINETDPSGECFKCWKVAGHLVTGGNIASATYGIRMDIRTITSRTATPGARLLALGSIGSEVFSPVSAREAKAGVRLVKHHIVAQGAGRARQARLHLTSFGIDARTASVNIKPMRQDVHRILHRQSYHDQVRDRVLSRSSKEDICEELCRIGDEIERMDVKDVAARFPLARSDKRSR